MSGRIGGGNPWAYYFSLYEPQEQRSTEAQRNTELVNLASKHDSVPWTCLSMKDLKNNNEDLQQKKTKEPNSNEQL